MPQRIPVTLATSVACASLWLVASAANPTGGRSAAAPAEMPGMSSTAVAQPGDSQATGEFRAANLAMHHAMEITYSNNPDIDFARSMIPHHQGAVAMAKIELTYGKDPTMRALATAIIRAQEDEIALMRSWLGQQGAR